MPMAITCAKAAPASIAVVSAGELTAPPKPKRARAKAPAPAPIEVVSAEEATPAAKPKRTRAKAPAAASTAAVNAQTTETIALRGRSQSVRLFGARGGTPVIVSSGDGGWMHLAPHVADVLAAHDVNVWDGHNYAWEITGALGIRDKGSAVRVRTGRACRARMATPFQARCPFHAAP